MTTPELIIRLRTCAPGEGVTVRLTWEQAQWWAEYIFRREMNARDARREA